MTPSKHPVDETYQAQMEENAPRRDRVGQEFPATQAAWWVRAITELGSSGVIAAILAYTVYRLLSGAPTSADVRAIQAAMDAHIVTTNSELGMIRILIERTLLIQRQVCFNTSDSEKSRASCQDVGR